MRTGPLCRFVLCTLVGSSEVLSGTVNAAAIRDDIARTGSRAASLALAPTVRDTGAATGPRVRRHLRSGACLPPEVLAFTAFPDTLAAPGSVSLAWAVAGAGAVAVSPGGTGLPAVGALALDVSGPTTVTLLADGPCVTATAALTIAVGGPAAPSVFPASGSPGQVVTVTLANVADPATVAGVSFTFPGDIEVVGRVAQATGAATVQVLVPFAPSSQPPGYLSGAATVAVATPAGKSAAVPFTVTELSYPGDAVADFTTWAGQLDQGVQSSLAQQRAYEGSGFTGFADFTDVLGGAASQYAAMIEKIGNDVQAGGTATVPIDLPTVSTPAPQTVTVTRQDLVNLMALRANLEAAAPAAAQQELVATSQSACILSDPEVAFCKAKETVDPQNMIGKLLNLAGLGAGAIDVIRCVAEVGQSGLGTALGYAGKLNLMANLVCDLLPVALDSFQIAYEPASGCSAAPPVAVRGTACGVLNAKLVSRSLKNALAQYLYNLATQQLTGNLNQISTACPGLVGPMVTQLVNLTFGDYFKQTLSDAIGKLTGDPPPAARLVVVGACDLPQVKSGNRDILLKLSDGDPRYYELHGEREGQTNLKVFPDPTHFIYPADFPEDKKSGPFKVPVTVGDPLRMKLFGPSYSIGTPSTPNCTLTNESGTGEATEDTPVIMRLTGCSNEDVAFKGYARLVQTGRQTWQLSHFYSFLGCAQSGSACPDGIYGGIDTTFNMSIHLGNVQAKPGWPQSSPPVNVTTSAQASANGGPESNTSFYIAVLPGPSWSQGGNPLSVNKSLSAFGTQGRVNDQIGVTLLESLTGDGRSGPYTFNLTETTTIDVPNP